MMKRGFIVHIFLLFSVLIYSQESLNIRKVKSIDRGSTSYSGSWVYVNDAGEEYGLVGSASGTAIYSLEEGMDSELAWIIGPPSRWREYTVIGDQAFVTTEGNGTDEGLQVIELGQLPDTAFLLTTYDSTFTRGHILQKDIFNPDEPYIYVSGTDSTGGVHILDVSDPMVPVEIGLHDPKAYIHDVHIRGDRMYTFQFYTALIEIVDISDKTNPVVLATFEDPGDATHSGWTSADNNYLLVADERNGFDGRIFDIRDLDNISEVSTFTSNPMTFVHNPYVRGDFAYLAHNREGLRIYDIVDPTNPVEVGFYNTVTEDNPNSGGLWSACPFAPSGKVIGGDRDLGLLVWEPTEVYASRLSGLVRDAETLASLDSVHVIIEDRDSVLFTNGLGEFKSGYPGELTVNITFEKEGYITEQASVALRYDEDQMVDILMTPIGNTSTLSTPKMQPLSIYPNPVSDVLVLNLEDQVDAYQLCLMDNLGRTVHNRTIEGLTDFSITVKEYPAGTYIVQVLNKDAQVVGVGKVEIVK